MLVLGKGITGKSVHKFLLRRRIKHDYLNTDELTNFNYKTVIKSPGINNSLLNFRKNNVDIINDVELMYQIMKKNIIAVTGTNGKSTTTALISHITGYKACGNIGIPLFDVCEKYENLVIEMSSFMLEDIKYFRPNIGIILNLGNAHLDRYNNIYDYHNAKLRIIKNMKKSDYLIYNEDDLFIKNYIKKLNCKKIKISTKNKSDCYIKNNKIYFNKKFIMKYKTKLYGDNRYNILACVATCKILNIKNHIIKKRIKTFKPLEFRMEKIKKNIFNDSKSTNVKSTINSLKTLNNVILICGGYDRFEDYDELIPYLKKIKLCLAYGKSSKRIEEFMIKYKISILTFKNLEELIIYLSRIKYRKTILFSPFHASYDLYSNFIERGKHFNELIKKYKI